MAGPSRKEIAEENQLLLRRWRELRTAAAYVSVELARLSFVQRTALFGSAAAPLNKEMPRFREFRRAGVVLWRECKDIDLAVWASRLDDLRALQRARVEGLKRVAVERDITFAHHQVEIFLVDAERGNHLGRLCCFRSCPADKRDCLVPGCGKERFLRQVEGFQWRAEAVSGDRCIILYDPHGSPPVLADAQRFDGDTAHGSRRLTALAQRHPSRLS